MYDPEDELTDRTEEAQTSGNERYNVPDDHNSDNEKGYENA